MNDRPRPSEQMVARIPVHHAAPSPAGAGTHQGKPKFEIVIPAEDGTVLVRMREERGVLIIDGEESRWDEGAKRFLYQMMQWSGQVGILWQSEVKKAAGEGA